MGSFMRLADRDRPSRRLRKPGPRSEPASCVQLQGLSMNPPTVYEREIRFETSDGVTLAGRLFAPDTPTALMTINGATGYPARFYASFAKAAAENGWAALTWDYRGQAGSRAYPPHEDRAAMLDWARYDMPGAARWLKQSFQGLPLDLVGHSVGGHFAPLVHAEAPLRKVALLSASSGFWGKQRAPLKLLAWSFWRVIGPAYLGSYGYVPRGLFWKGEDLPAGVFRDWRDWGVKPDYFRDRLAEEGLLSQFDRFDRPVTAWTPDDDPIATPEAVRWLLQQMPIAPTEMNIVRTDDLDRGRLGHHGLFLGKMSDVFWPQVFRWLSA